MTTVSILDLLRSLTVDSFKSRRLVASSSSSLFLLCVDVVKGNRTTIHSTRLDSRNVRAFKGGASLSSKNNTIQDSMHQSYCDGTSGRQAGRQADGE